MSTPDNFYEVDGVAYDQCVFPSPSSTAALCCLWDDPEQIAGQESGGFFMVGNCVTAVGVSMLLRTLLLNTRIDTLVVRGADLTGTRGMIRKAMLQGEIGEPELADAVQELLAPARQEGGPVDVYRLRRDRTPRLLPMPPPPPRDSVTDRGDPGLRLTGPNLWKVWPRLLRQVALHGADSGTAYGYRQRELLSPTWVFGVRETLDQPVPAWFEGLRVGDDAIGKSLEELDSYNQSSLLEPSRDPALAYTYGHRLRGRWDDQVQRAIALLSEQPDQRRVTLSTWDPGERGEVHLGLDAITRPSDMMGKYPPCLTQLWFRRDADGSLYTHGTFRSHDLLRAGPTNAWGLCRLAELVADALGWELGQLAITSHSAHIYEIDWGTAEQVGQERGRAVMEWDPRSTLRVRSLDGMVTVDLLVDGMVAAQEQSRTALRVTQAVLSAGWVTTLSHATWLGRRCAEVEASIACSG